MIVNHAEGGWNIIFQRSHALLAGKIAMQWKVTNRPEPWTDVLSAIINHDDGQHDWHHQQHLTEAGAPLDFTFQEPDMMQAKRAVANARYRSRWIALLTSMHTSALYESQRGKNPEVDDFLDEQQHYQEKLRRAVSIRKAEAETLYRFVFFCDACSLVLCKDEVPQNGKRLELAETPDQQTAYISYQEDESVSVKPWPFENPSFTVEVDVFLLKQLTFMSDEELYEALNQADVQTKTWAFKR